MNKIYFVDLSQNFMPVSSSYISDILGIAEKQLGELYISIDDLTNPNNIILCAFHNHKVAGFCIGRNMERDEFFTYNPLIKQLNIKSLEIKQNIGVIASIAVDPLYEGKGTGSELFKKCLDSLEKKGADIFVMTGWKSSKGVNISGIAKKFGFEYYAEIPAYWKDDSIKRGYKCPSCGNPPCLCSAILFIRHK